ncbi:hypothetical protein LEMLEM_LOCUS8793 [Lemmus lemmus]
MCSVPHGGERWETQDRSKPLGPFWPEDRTSTRLFLHGCKQEQRYCLDRSNFDGIFGEPKEIYPWH